MTRRVILSLLLLLVARRVDAATYYVSTSGNDANSCATAQSTTQSNQKRTISAGVACATTPGDTVYIHAGTYTDAGDVIDSNSFTVASGTNFTTGAITISGYPGETVTMQPPDGAHAIRLSSGSPHHIIIQDLILDIINSTVPISNPDTIFVSGGAHHNRFQRLELKNNASSGVHFSSSGGASGSNELLNCSIHDNGRLDSGNSGYGFYLSTSDNLIEGNDFYANNGYAIHINPLVGEGNRNIIRGNRIHANFVHGPSAGGGSTSYGIAVVRGDSNLISNNLIYGNQGGILLYNDSTNTLVYNNTITGNLGHGGGGGGEYAVEAQFYDHLNPPIVRNNIIYGNTVGTIKDWGDDPGDGTAQMTLVQDHNLTTDPSFVDAASFDFRLQSGSAARNAGTTLAEVPSDFLGVPRPQAGAYDIGAYEATAQTEYGSSTVGVVDAATLQSNINTAAGNTTTDTVWLSCGVTYTSNFNFPAHGGTNYITFKSTTNCGAQPGPGVRTSPAYSAAYATLQPTDTGMTTSANADYYAFENVRFANPSSSAYWSGTIMSFGAPNTETVSANQPDHVVFDRTLWEGDATRGMNRGLGIHASNWTVKNSYFRYFFRGGQQSQCLATWNGPGPGTTDNNYLSCAGENFLSGGADPSITDLRPSNLTLTRNYFTKDPAWNGASTADGAISSCNLLELKNASHVLIDGNIFEYSWAPAGCNQSGYAWNFNSIDQSGTCYWCGTDNIVARNNIVRNAGEGMTLCSHWCGFGGSATPTLSVVAGGSLVSGHVYEVTQGYHCTVGGYTHAGVAAQITPSGGNLTIRTHVFSSAAYGQPTGCGTVDGIGVFARDVTAGEPVVRLVAAPYADTTADRDITSNAWGAGTMGYVEILMHDVEISNNLFYNITTDNGGNGYLASIGNNPDQLTIKHNTIDGPVGKIGGIFYFQGSTTPRMTAVLRDNAVVEGPGTVSGDGTFGWVGTKANWCPSTCTWTNTAVSTDFTLNPLYYELAGTLQITTANWASNTFTTPASGNYRAKTSSALYHAASDGTDIGVDMCNGSFPDPAGNGSTVFSCSSPPVRLRRH